MTTTVENPPDTVKEPRRSASSLVDAVFRAREISIAGALALLILGTYMANPRFLSDQGIKDLLLNASILVLLAVGQSAVVITRNIDLSVGSVVGLSAFACGKFVARTDHGVLTVMLLGIAIGVVCGLVSGALVSFGGVPALVVTLGMLYVIQGVDYWWAQGDQISAADVPEAVLGLGSGSVLGVPYLPLMALVLLAATTYYLRSYRSGRELYAIGSSPEAARLAGHPDPPPGARRVRLLRGRRRIRRRPVARPLRHRRRRQRARLGTDRRQRRRRRRCRHHRRHRHGMGRRARSPAAHHHRQRPGRPEGGLLLAGRDHRCAPPAGHQRRPDREPADDRRTEEEERPS
ncbi:hypothetical protein QFZ58_004809 [Streptomyces sp. B1I3]|nr:hypothetical protein [Streptomyces sp. B1I3]